MGRGNGLLGEFCKVHAGVCGHVWVGSGVLNVFVWGGRL